MPNLEIKAKCADLSSSRVVAKRLATEYVGFLKQVDTYFGTKAGRLKLREINDEEAQLIPYEKNYKAGPTKSDYAVIPIADPGLVKGLLGRILGQEAVVSKRREVFLFENVRIHLDQVDGLGEYIEFEAVYDDDSEVAAQREKVEMLVREFGIADASLLGNSYVDQL